jgi:hypothetical protein
LLQTFTGLKTIFVEDIPVTAFYNDSLRELVVAAKKIVTVKCEPKINLDATDGDTHLSAVSLVLLNELFQFLVTASVCSTIIIWDIWKGRRVNLITRAHTRVRHGEVQLIAITAGCFEPNQQFLLTAGGKTVKVWNFNEGLCLREIEIEGSLSVSQVFWTNHRIFAIGQTINEFHDSNDYEEHINRAKVWRNSHQSEILCSSIRESDAVVTSCTSGDLIFWRYDTGKAYMRFNVRHPSQRLQLVYYGKFFKTKIDERLGAKHKGDNNNKLYERFPKPFQLNLL